MKQNLMSNAVYNEFNVEEMQNSFRFVSTINYNYPAPFSKLVPKSVLKSLTEILLLYRRYRQWDNVVVRSADFYFSNDINFFSTILLYLY
jgi:hypothetical protein